MSNHIDIDAIREHYHGFFLSGPIGNNAFSFEARETKQIYVAPLIRGELSDLKEGIGIAFSEMKDGKEFNAFGLTDFIYTRINEKDVFIFDNHNHAFFFWNFMILNGSAPHGLQLLHVDQHKDGRKPEIPFHANENIAEIFDYTNFVLNVGNFIEPAFTSGLFSSLETITSSQDFEKDMSGQFVLDLDMDIFAPEMDYISYDLKVQRIRSWIKRSSFITIATSPYFIDQQRAIKIIKDIFLSS
jgi:hypothetical protein